jgi:hypothetical protein
MRLLFQFILPLSLLLMACQGGSGPETIRTDSLPVVQPARPDPMNGQEEALQKMAEDLGSLKPDEPSKLKAMLPALLMGGTKLAEEAGENNGVPMALARYKINDTILVELTIYDCAGPAGAGYFNTHFAALASARGETDQEYTRGVELGSQRGFEQGEKSGGLTTLTWMVNRRYLTTLNGTRVGPAALRQAASSIRF